MENFISIDSDKFTPFFDYFKNKYNSLIIFENSNWNSINRMIFDTFIQFDDFEFYLCIEMDDNFYYKSFNSKLGLKKVNNFLDLVNMHYLLIFDDNLDENEVKSLFSTLFSNEDYMIFFNEYKNNSENLKQDFKYNYIGIYIPAEVMGILESKYIPFSIDYFSLHKLSNKIDKSKLACKYVFDNHECRYNQNISYYNFFKLLESSNLKFIEEEGGIESYINVDFKIILNTLNKDYFNAMKKQQLEIFLRVENNVKYSNSNGLSNSIKDVLNNIMRIYKLNFDDRHMNIIDYQKSNRGFIKLRSLVNSSDIRKCSNLEMKLKEKIDINYHEFIDDFMNSIITKDLKNYKEETQLKIIKTLQDTYTKNKIYKDKSVKYFIEKICVIVFEQYFIDNSNNIHLDKFSQFERIEDIYTIVVKKLEKENKDIFHYLDFKYFLYAIDKLVD